MFQNEWGSSMMIDERELGVGEHHEDDPAESGDGKAKTVIQTQKKKKKFSNHSKIFTPSKTLWIP
jgi:hypothetical protein